MAKNDYPVIVYQILSYLYKCLKSGNDVQGILLNYDSPMFDKINKKYWEYIMHNLVKYNLIEGIIEVNVDGKPTPYILERPAENGASFIKYANNDKYIHNNSYTVTLIDSDPDSIIVDEILKLPFTSFDRQFKSDNLNHFVFTIYN